MTNIKIAIFVIGLFLTLQIEAASIKILFDNTKAEQAGNADWVISNSSSPVRIPTPAQSGITSSTPETFWVGALSGWGIDCVKKGFTVESLVGTSQITYGNSSNSQDLSNYQVYIVCEPNTVFTTAEKTAMMNFVKNGGGLFMISDHTVSDRNNDGWDSPAIWIDFLTNNTVQNNPFGITVDLANISQTSTNIAALPKDSILHGPMGNVTEVMWSNGTTFTINKTVNPSVVGQVFKIGASTTGTTGVLFATARYGKGKVAIIGDSSPCDDGTGGSSKLYPGYFGDANGNHQLLLMNATIWLATPSITTGIKSIETRKSDFQLYPNPVSDGKLHVNYSLNNSSNTKIQLFDATGKNVKTIAASNVSADSRNELVDVSDLKSGIYLCRLSTGKETITKTVIIRK
jgi:hypothetical protein